MNYSIIPVALLVSLATISELVLAEHSNSRAWLQYKRQHGTVYATPEEDAQRFSLFLAAKEQIRQHNSDETVSFKLGLNQFSDWTRDELTKLIGSSSQNVTEQQRSVPAEPTELHPSLRAILDDPTPLPKEVDWRKVTGRVTSVKDQTLSTCDASYSFAAAGVLEGQLLVQNPNITKLVSLSAQQELDCGGRNFGCFSTGTANRALDDVADIGGILTDKDYPYCGWCEMGHKCSFSKDKVVMSITGSAMLPRANGDALKTTVASFGPVAIAMQRGEKFKSYRSGIYDDKTCSQGVDHWVLLVGYGTDPTHGDYWIVKNSYGTPWGEHGYMRVKQGMCAISLYSTIPTFT